MQCTATWDPMTTALVGAVLVLVVLLAGVGLVWLRRRVLSSEGRGGAAGRSFSIEGLEEMRRAGQISEQEFRTLRRAALGLDVGSREAGDPASSLPPAADDKGQQRGADGPCADADASKE
jgi:hypothetical protein